MMIDRAIKLRESLEDYKDKVLRLNDPADDNVKLDQITPDDWEILTKVKSILKPFYEIPKRLGGNTVKSLHGALWEVVLGLECLIQSLKEWKLRLTNNDVSTRQLNICVGLAIDKLMEYVGKTARSPVWLTALVLYPKYRWKNLSQLWQHVNQQSLFQASQARVKNMWQTDYRGRVITEPDTINNGDTYNSDGEKDVFRFFNHASSQTVTNPDTSDLSDEYLQYISKEPVEESVPNPLDWWRRHQQFYPNLSQMAFDLFAVPAMSSECGV